MVRLSNAEKEILIAVWDVIRSKKTATRNTVEQTGKGMFSKNLKNWPCGFKKLVRKALLKEKKGVLTLSAQGVTVAKKLFKIFYKQRVNKIFVRYEQSKAYAHFCERVFGKNLYQVSMMDMEQLDRLLEILDINRSKKILDMGCGIGRITEYISDVTQAHITGVDIADAVIKRANKRTKGKRYRLIFRTGDMDDLKWLDKEFDVIIAIDTLYFVDDLVKTVGQMGSILRPGGQMGLFYTQVAKPGESDKHLLPKGTELGQALCTLNLRFKAYNLTKNEHGHWKRCKQAAETLKSEFDVEGNSDCCYNLIDEAEQILKYVNTGRIRRYLYHVKV